MSQKTQLKRLLQSQDTVTKQQAKEKGIRHPRQQVYFLRQDGENIINTEKRTYKLIRSQQ